MGANTRYYVRVVRPVKEWVEVSAITEEEAVEEAKLLTGVISVKDVKHWTEFEGVDGC